MVHDFIECITAREPTDKEKEGLSIISYYFTGSQMKLPTKRRDYALLSNFVLCCIHMKYILFIILTCDIYGMMSDIWEYDIMLSC